MYHLIIKFTQNHRKHWLPATTIHFHTYDDSQDALYTFLNHLISAFWKDVKKVKRYIVWEVLDDDIKMVVNERPAYIAMDPCKISYDMLKFQGNVTGRNNYKSDPASTMYVLPNLRMNDVTLPVWDKIPDNCVVMFQQKAVDSPPPFEALRVERILVRTHRQHMDDLQENSGTFQSLPTASSHRKRRGAGIQ